MVIPRNTPVAPSIREIAAACGVHHSTVSRALNGDTRISRDRQAEIKALAQSMGYRPSPAISAMMRSRRARAPGERSLNIALLQDIIQPGQKVTTFSEKVRAGVRQRSEELGYLLQTFAMEREGVSETAAARILYHRGIRGVIIPPLRGESLEWGFDLSRVSAVCVGYSLVSPVLHRVSDHHSVSMQRAVKEIAALGYQRLGLVLRRRTHEHVGHFWTGAYLAEVAEHRQLSRLPVFIGPPEDFSGDPASGRMAEWLKKQKPDAVIAETENSAGRVETAARSLGRHDLYIASMLVDGAKPRFPGIDQRPELIGYEAMNLLNELIMHGETGVPEFPKTVLTPGLWVAKEASRHLVK